MTEVLLSERARERLADLEPDIQARIKDALRDISPDRGLSPLSGEDVYRFRVGDNRVITDWDQSNDTVYVLTLGHRGNITTVSGRKRPRSAQFYRLNMLRMRPVYRTACMRSSPR